jgi:hypothetical protein
MHFHFHTYWKICLWICLHRCFCSTKFTPATHGFSIVCATGTNCSVLGMHNCTYIFFLIVALYNGKISVIHCNLVLSSYPFIHFQSGSFSKLTDQKVVFISWFAHMCLMFDPSRLLWSNTTNTNVRDLDRGMNGINPLVPPSVLIMTDLHAMSPFHVLKTLIMPLTWTPFAQLIFKTFCVQYALKDNNLNFLVNFFTITIMLQHVKYATILLLTKFYILTLCTLVYNWLVLLFHRDSEADWN